MFTLFVCPREAGEGHHTLLHSPTRTRTGYPLAHSLPQLGPGQGTPHSPHPRPGPGHFIPQHPLPCPLARTRTEYPYPTPNCPLARNRTGYSILPHHPTLSPFPQSTPPHPCRKCHGQDTPRAVCLLHFHARRHSCQC